MQLTNNTIFSMEKLKEELYGKRTLNSVACNKIIHKFKQLRPNVEQASGARLKKYPGIIPMRDCFHLPSNQKVKAASTSLIPIDCDEPCSEVSRSKEEAGNVEDDDDVNDEKVFKTPIQSLEAQRKKLEIAIDGTSAKKVNPFQSDSKAYRVVTKVIKKTSATPVDIKEMTSSDSSSKTNSATGRDESIVGRNNILSSNSVDRMSSE